jgi:hypothetical protein
LSFTDRDDNVRLIPLEQNALTAQNTENIQGPSAAGCPD